MRRPRRFLHPIAAATLALGLVALEAGPAAAHESREVGPYTLTVGWWTEPAFANQPNGPQITVVETRGEDPVVEGVDLEVEIVFGDQAMTAAMEPAFVVGAFGDPGSYEAQIFPTRPGTYTFHFTGTVEGRDIDEEFTSGPDTFSDVQDPAEAAFPEADPAAAELADRIEQESGRAAELVAQAEDQATSARTLALIALVVGALGLIAAVALAGVAMRRRRI